MTTSTRASSVPPRSSPSTSTPPAWHWLEEKYVPVTTDPGYYPADVDEMCHNYTEAELSLRSRKASDSGSLRECNDSSEPPRFSRNPSGELQRDQCPDCRCAPNIPHAPDCAGVQSVRETPTKLRVGAPNEHTADVRVESCPECGTVTDIEYGPEFALLPKRESGAEEETFDVPFKVQEFMFEELAPAGAEYLHDLLNDHMDRIIEMARDRFRKGYAKFGSEMYSWTSERRLDETLQELADAVVYPTSGPIE